ncbi:extracellular catalytic domain type 2 short-chain-length polyhydroxyalkanoate depolymerase [Burkholderia alba]|uniref:extracellular catalytic domain type 2 short-chain-length polyhydroxyalkanoate depolymerase n=1 Tax=Burkholderia alba TaxID=2683677 RepID=UPI002B0583BE|nr:poly(3-hydroxybutyrate) depolymerase [Burkholderia alba]
MTAAAAIRSPSSLRPMRTVPGRVRRLPMLARRLVLAACAASAGIAHAADPAPLPALGADLRQVSVSGLSSGAFMAAQFDVAWSSRLIGAGIIAGGAFHCAGESALVDPATAAMTLCMRPLGEAPSAAHAWRDAQRFAKAREIDDPAGLRKQRIYLFSGAKDTVVATRVVDQAARFYQLAGVPERNLRYRRDPDAGHALITGNPGDAACDANRSPYINHCGFDLAQDILRWIYAKPGAPLNPPAGQAGGQLLAFDQRAFDPARQASLAATGYAYVPADCDRAACAVHVAFHGCAQSVASIGQRFVRDGGYNALADTNRIVVLYPQVEKSSVNPLGCWDFWGYSSPDPDHPNFSTREAPQMRAVMAMIRRLGEARP